MASKTKKQTAKDQGVPAPYLGPTGTFKPGLDARLKSDLVNAALELPAPDALHTFTKKQALALIKKRGWTSFLTRKREIVAARTAKAKASVQ